MTFLDKPIRASSVFILIVLFFLMLRPLALDFHFYYPDEVHYSDAALQMAESGDYLTPLTANGEHRFNKPILTYWFIVAAYKIFGISPFSTRIFFLFAAMLTLWLVYKIALLVCSEKKTAFLASAICASHVTFLMSSTRAIPDILLALFVTLAAYGATGILLADTKLRRSYLWWFYIGFALAFEVKGIPALALGGVSYVFLLFNPWKRTSIKHLIYWPAIVVALGITLFWPVTMWLIHGNSFFDLFYTDQVGVRVSFSIINSIKNLAIAVFLFVMFFFPWNIFVAPIKKTEKPVFIGFVLWLVATIVLLSALTQPFYERYLLPVVPLASIALALFVENKKVVQVKTYKFVQLIVVFISVLLGSLALLLMWNINFEAVMLTIVLVMVFAEVFIAIKAFHNGVNWLNFTLSILILPFLLSFSTSQISFPNDGKQLATAIELSGIQNNERIGFIGNFEAASKARIHLEGKYTIVNLDSLSNETTINFDYLIGNYMLYEFANVNNYEVLPVALFWEKIPVCEMLSSVLKNKYQQFMKLHASNYYLVGLKQIPPK